MECTWNGKRSCSDLINLWLLLAYRVKDRKTFVTGVWRCVWAENICELPLLATACSQQWLTISGEQGVFIHLIREISLGFPSVKNTHESQCVCVSLRLQIFTLIHFRALRSQTHTTSGVPAAHRRNTATQRSQSVEEGQKMSSDRENSSPHFT